MGGDGFRHRGTGQALPFLRRRAKRLGPRFKLTHTDIAELVGASRQSVTVAIEALAARGVIRCDPRHPSRIEVLEVDAGREIAEQNRKVSNI